MSVTKNELKHLRSLIDSMTDAKNGLAYYSGEVAHEIGEKTFIKIDELIEDLEDVYIARVNTCKRK